MKGTVLARHDGDFRANTQGPLSLEDLLALFGDSSVVDLTREDAIACYLSASEGWREAMKKLGGAFDESAAGLKGRKDD